MTFYDDEPVRSKRYGRERGDERYHELKENGYLLPGGLGRCSEEMEDEIEAERAGASIDFEIYLDAEVDRMREDDRDG